MVSVVIPLYNKEKQVGRTLCSVLRQAFADFEIIVVDDGSTDGSAAVVRSVADGRIRLVQQENAGVSAARNRGIAEARYGLVAFLDADDEWHPGYLEALYGLAQSYPHCSVFACGYEFVRADGSHASPVVRNLPFEGECGVLSHYFEVASRSHPPLWTSAVMVRKEALLAVGGFPEGIQWGEDLLTWARLALRYPIAYSRRCLSSYIFVPASAESSLPRDIADVPDRVAQELMLLEKQHRGSPASRGMGRYIALWFKMRAHTNLAWGKRGAAARLACFSLRYHLLNAKVWAMLLLSALPSGLLRRIFRTTPQSPSS